jgi:hypothetical protein
MRPWLAIAGAMLFSACAETTPAPPVAPGGSDPAERAAVARFAAWETGWLAELGAIDPRLAARMPVKPPGEVIERVAAAAVVRGGPDLGIAFGAIDVFSFGERERQLRVLGDDLARQGEPNDPASRRERALLRRLLDGEQIRVVRERVLPESASERVRAIVATWGVPGSTREVAARENLVARGLADVIPAVAQGRLSRPRSLELEDELDALERLAVPEGYPDATRTITALRIELGKAHGGALASSAPPAIPLEAQLTAYVGRPALASDARALASRLEEDEQVLRADAKARLARMPDHTMNEVLAAAASHVDVEGRCRPPADRSPVRAMAPPPERVFVCDLLALVAGALVPPADTVAVIALHDDVAIALWALALDAGAADLDATRAAHPLLASMPHDRQDRLVRAALVSPARAIAPGLAAVILDADGPSARQDRAARWLAAGDAPFDLVAEDLAAKPGGDR